MKLKKTALIIALVIFVLAVIPLILLPGSGNLYVAFASCLLAEGMMLRCVFRAEKKKIPDLRRRLKRRMWILPASLLISVVVLALQYGRILSLPCEMHIVAQLAVLAVGAIKLLSIGDPKRYSARPAESPKPAEKPAEEPKAETEK